MPKHGSYSGAFKWIKTESQKQPFYKCLRLIEVMMRGRLRASNYWMDLWWGSYKNKLLTITSVNKKFRKDGISQITS